MTNQRDGKGLTNEILPDSTRAAEELAAGTPRGRTAAHLKRILAAGLFLQLSGEIAGCGSSDPPRPKAPEPNVQKPATPTTPVPDAVVTPKPLEPSGYGVVDPLPQPSGPMLGTLDITSTPSANIIVDGRPTGLVTPQPVMLLVAGSHTIRLEAVSEKLVQTFNVEIKAGATERVVRDLRSVPPPKGKK